MHLRRRYGSLLPGRRPRLSRCAHNTVRSETERKATRSAKHDCRRPRRAWVDRLLCLRRLMVAHEAMWRRACSTLSGHLRNRNGSLLLPAAGAAGGGFRNCILDARYVYNWKRLRWLLVWMWLDSCPCPRTNTLPTATAAAAAAAAQLEKDNGTKKRPVRPLLEPWRILVSASGYT